jgi:hypothetical protein
MQQGNSSGALENSPAFGGLQQYARATIEIEALPGKQLLLLPLIAFDPAVEFGSIDVHQQTTQCLTQSL